MHAETFWFLLALLVFWGMARGWFGGGAQVGAGFLYAVLGRFLGLLLGR